MSNIPFLNEIVCGDSFQKIKEIPDESIDIIITSPPYNFNMDYDITNDKAKWMDYLKNLEAMWKECYRVLKPAGRLCVNIQPCLSEYFPTHHLITTNIMAQKFLWMTEILWEKNNYNCSYTAWGSWKSPSAPFLKITWEFIEVFCKESRKKIGNVENIDISGEEYKKWTYAKWEIAPEQNMKKYNHPAMFPEELCVRLLKLFSYENDIVLDPFNGAGTTTYVAFKLNRNFIGIDISENYCNTARKRISDEKGKSIFFPKPQERQQEFAYTTTPPVMECITSLPKESQEPDVYITTPPMSGCIIKFPNKPEKLIQIDTPVTPPIFGSAYYAEAYKSSTPINSEPCDIIPFPNPIKEVTKDDGENNGDNDSK